jgi:hypothetical protein
MISPGEIALLKEWDEIWVPRLDHPLRDEIREGEKHYSCHWRRTRVIRIFDTGVGFNHISCHLGFATWAAIHKTPPIPRGTYKLGQLADVTIQGWIPAEYLREIPLDNYIQKFNHAGKTPEKPTEGLDPKNTDAPA